MIRRPGALKRVTGTPSRKREGFISDGEKGLFGGKRTGELLGGGAHFR